MIQLTFFMRFRRVDSHCVETLYLNGEENCIVDHLWSREEYNLITCTKNPSEFEAAILRILNYFSTFHKLSIFHGDIKPENLFFERGKSRWGNISDISTDSGSIIKMDPIDDKKVYFISCATPAFSSPQHIYKMRS